jgi:hypothetical protein
MAWVHERIFRLNDRCLCQFLRGFFNIYYYYYYYVTNMLINYSEWLLLRQEADSSEGDKKHVSPLTQKQFEGLKNRVESDLYDDLSPSIGSGWKLRWDKMISWSQSATSQNRDMFWGYVAVCVQLYCRWFAVLRLVVAVLHYMFRPTWPSSSVYDVLLLYSWRKLTDNKKRQAGKNTHTRIRKLTKKHNRKTQMKTCIV